jgi:hypothetical protein
VIGGHAQRLTNIHQSEASSYVDGADVMLAVAQPLGVFKHLQQKGVEEKKHSANFII